MAPLVIEKDYGHLLIESALHSLGFTNIKLASTIPPDMNVFVEQTTRLPQANSIHSEEAKLLHALTKHFAAPFDNLEHFSPQGK